MTSHRRPRPATRPVDPVVIEQLLAHDKEIIVAVWSIRAACAAPEKNDGAGVEAFDETVYRFREVGIFYRSLLHRVYISAPRAKSNEDTGKEGSMVGPGEVRPALIRQQLTQRCGNKHLL
jgi:hypothetical protein